MQGPIQVVGENCSLVRTSSIPQQLVPPVLTLLLTTSLGIYLPSESWPLTFLMWLQEHPRKWLLFRAGINPSVPRWRKDQGARTGHGQACLMIRVGSQGSEPEP